MITSLELLSREDCARIVGRVKELREHWISRGQSPSFFHTLGVASYLDEPADYRARAGALNAVLRDHFSWVYDRLLDFLTHRLRRPAVMADGLGHPGFHIWEEPGIFLRPEASVHFDLQYERAFGRDVEGADYDRPLSFTVPLRLPQRGGGLNVWDVDYARFLRFREHTGARLKPADLPVLLDRIRHPYSVGAIAMHSGHLLHQIGEVDQVFPGDERITLQGHALLCGGEWKLYW
jgi:hypothetical protein